MSVTRDPGGYGAHLEGLVLDPRLSDGTPSERADIARSLLTHLFHAGASGSVSAAALGEAQGPYRQMYHGVVDNFDEEKGLNNFAEAALALCNLHRNESQSWTSSLSAEKFLSSARGKHFQKLCQKSAEHEAGGRPADHVVRCRTDLSVTSEDGGEVRVSPPRDLAQQSDIANQNVPSSDKSVESLHPSNQKVATSDLPHQTVSNRPPCSGPVIGGSGGGNVWGPPTNQTTPGCLVNDRVHGNNCYSETAPQERQGNPVQGSGNSNSHQFGNASKWPSEVQTCQNSAGSFGRQNNFSFKKNVVSCRNELPYELPPGWDDPGAGSEVTPGNPGYHTGFRGIRPGFHGDQEVPRKPLFSSGWSGVGAVRPQAPPTRPPPPQNFYRRTEAPRGCADLFKTDAGEEDDVCVGPFKTAKEQLSINQQKKYGGQTRGPVKPAAYGNAKKSLGTRRGPSSKFVPPVVSRDEPGDSNLLLRKAGPGKAPPGGDEPQDERLKGLEPKMIELITNEIMDHGAPVAWDDIAGLEFAKKTIKEIVVWPMLRPDIFTGLRGPPKGLLLFGPPGTGKTLIGKCIASQSKSTFFSISASSLTSKWVGEGEKMVKALFTVSRCHQPAVIFIDEIDSLLSQRTDGEHEASRRIKTEFLVQLDGATTESDERLLVIGATNRPQEIDEAARRRFVKRLYIPLPEKTARRQIILNLLSAQRYQLSEEELDVICQETDGYSGSDMANLCREAALGPIRSIDFGEIEQITADQVRPITFEDFSAAVSQVRASVSAKDLDLYIDWNRLFGCGGK